MPTKSLTTKLKKKSQIKSIEEHIYSTTDWLGSSDRTPRIHGAIIGRLASVDDTGEPRVDFPGNVFGVVLGARSILPLSKDKAGREVLLIFEAGDLERPIVVGLLETYSAQTSEPLECKAKVAEESLVLTAEREIVLRCGRASITLNSGGKVLIQGSYLVSRSSGTNRIKGGSVQIN